VRICVWLVGLVLALSNAVAAGMGVGESPAAPEDSGWTPALPGWRYEFPRDHGPHRDFKTEWWYFTGSLRDSKSGKSFGYELTFFRQGIRPVPRNAAVDAISRFAVDDFKFAHFAISDLDGKKFHFDSKVTRGAFAEAGFGDPSAPDKPLAWIDDWSLTLQADGSWRIAARNAKMKVDFLLRPSKQPVIHGENGVSQKADGPGNASHYYSFTRMQTAGRMTVGENAFEMTGTTWFDHEWASNQLGKDQVGWDWFCFQFEDGSELMLYTLRQRDGSIDPNSSGTLVDANGDATHLRREDFSLQASRRWKSERTGGSYPIAWEISIPSRELVIRVSPRLDNQELALGVINYWEGAVSATGSRAGRALSGVGYMELTGYVEALGALK
jgi:predicted secreted hydrolase